MAISRGQFLKSIGNSVAGLAAETGVAAAATALVLRSSAVPAAATLDAGAARAGKEVAFIRSGKGDDRRIALTFDDGPTPGVTEKVLDELKARNLRATFFMIGKRVADAPELARRVAAEGHEIGNHTFHHRKLNALPDGQVKDEIQKTQDAIGNATGQCPVWLRPPYGAFRKDQMSVAESCGLGVVLWSVDPRDWSEPGEAKIVETILTETRPGSIILCHDLHGQTEKCLRQILDGFRHNNLECVTVSALLQNARVFQESFPSSRLVD